MGAACLGPVCLGPRVGGLSPGPPCPHLPGGGGTTWVESLRHSGGSPLCCGLVSVGGRRETPLTPRGHRVSGQDQQLPCPVSGLCCHVAE